MAVHVDEHLSGADVPNDNLVVGSGREQDIEGAGMPEHEPDSALVVQQVDHRLGERS